MEGIVKSYRGYEDGIIFKNYEMSYSIELSTINGEYTEGIVEAPEEDIQSLEVKVDNSDNVTPFRRD
jgi:hypothetical protein